MLPIKAKEDEEPSRSELALALLLGFTWDTEQHVYIVVQTGRVVLRSVVREWIDRAIENFQNDALSMTERFIAGEITHPEWASELMPKLRAMHTAMGSLAIGGQWDHTTAGRLGARLHGQYVAFNEMGLQVELGEQAKDGTLLNRIRLFVQAGRGTFEGMRRGLMSDSGFDQEMRVLHPAAHCDDCPPLSGFWAPIGTLPAIGESVCLTNCHCTFDYRNSRLG